MKRRIEKVVVLGAGTMGARIAAHFANAGVPVLLLDIVPPGLTSEAAAESNKIVRAGLEAAKKSKPAAFFTAALAAKISIGNFEDDLQRCQDADWIIEVVAENLDIKKSLLARVAQFRKPGAIVTTNTSGLPVHLIAEGMSEEFQRHWAGTHFFNPPRYLKLVELIPGPKTSPEVLETLAEFCDRRLGKGVVIAKDTPNFIANRIGTFSMMNALRLMNKLGMTIEEVDACTGPAIGQPKSATFRTADIVGLDVLMHVVKNIYETATDDESREMYKIPAFVEVMAKRKWLGDKTGQGFYKKLRGEGEGEREILTLDVNTMEYRPRQKERFASIEAGKTIEDTRDRLRALIGPVLAGQTGDKAQQFLWDSLSETCLYAARRVPEISDRVEDVDRAMRWGFGWEVGPFQIMDTLGVDAFAAKIKKEGRAVPPAIEKLLAGGRKSFYTSEKGVTSVFELNSGTDRKIEEPAGVIFLNSLKDAGKEVEHNSGASLIDLGDGVLSCEFHSKMNAIGADLISMLHKGLKRLETDFDAMVIANQAVNFSVGANLMLVLMGAQEQEWDELHLAVKQFQNANLAIKYAPKPVVTAPQG
ncbi:MAG: 3-hydroxyacyl-CoA dehydrogenase, partial [Acidobacteriaceae bacterium]|nr:3-hydroxyacyl-CoA dehydrogenase [Acidobacteriaceae bacterium]